jgi:hypothetical protein
LLLWNKLKVFQRNFLIYEKITLVFIIGNASYYIYMYLQFYTYWVTVSTSTTSPHSPYLSSVYSMNSTSDPIHNRSLTTGFSKTLQVIVGTHKRMMCDPWFKCRNQIALFETGIHWHVREISCITQRSILSRFFKDDVILVYLLVKWLA